MKKKRILLINILFLLYSTLNLSAKELSETSFLITTITSQQLDNQRIWDYIQTDKNTGIEISLTETGGEIFMSNSQLKISQLLNKLHQVILSDSLKLFPVFINFDGNITVLDSIISHSEISSFILFLPKGEAWPSAEYLIQSNRRIIFFINREVQLHDRMLHPSSDYIMEISAKGTSGLIPKINMELLMVRDFDKLAVTKTSGSNIRNLVPDYINFLLETWTKYGKRPNFIFIDTEILNFNFIISQLNSFTWIKGTVKSSGNTFERVYWKNPDILITGGRFSLPYRGGEELTLTPFVPGYRLTPEHIVVTGEMEVPETYSILAAPFHSGEGLTGSFTFDQSIVNLLLPQSIYNGTNYSFVQDIERGTVLRLPENSSINLKSPEIYGLRNSSFSVSCFVKFSEILQFGDNAVLGNYESEYRRGLHLILRSGHPYFGLWANDYISEEKLEPNVWYHLVWRYIVETGEQAIFLNGRNVGSSAGHPPFSGTGDIYLGSALSQGASMRGYIDELHFWNRPLGSEEITRLALNEPIIFEKKEAEDGLFLKHKAQIIAGIMAFLIIIFMYYIFFRKRNPAVVKFQYTVPKNIRTSQLSLFGGFQAIDKEGNDVSELFTPKVKELLLFVLLYTLKYDSGASVAEIDEQLWPGLDTKKVTNNRAVTLNKLRKILQRLEGISIITRNGTLVAELQESFKCDYVEAYNLCHLPEGMDKTQLELFFNFTKKGKFLKGISWTWLDEFRGYTGNQIMDNLLKLSVLYKEDKRLPEIEAISKGILEYDELNEEAVWLQIWCLRQKNNMHQAKFYFETFRARYLESMAEPYLLNFEQFNHRYSNMLLDLME
jgi:DNA-binding SARP family transcriptional activator